MITGDLKRSVDALWTEFWQGGITNPLTVIEQITFLIFIRLLDVHEARDQNRLARSGVEYKRRFNAEEQDIRWSQFRHLGGEAMLPLVRDRVFAHLRKTSIGATTAMDFMKDAQLMIQKNSLLTKAVTMIDNLPLTEGDTKGDLYEYLLSKLTTAGINGQFRTPRHIIRLMVDLVFAEAKDREELTWTVGDPAAGTGGFLVSVIEHLMQRYTSEKGMIEEGVNGDERFQTKPDILIKRRAETAMVIDTKWKRVGRDPGDAKLGVSQADVYQMMAYARLYRCADVMLLYPHHSGLGADALDVAYRMLEGNERLRIVSVDLVPREDEIVKWLATLTSPAKMQDMATA